MNNRYWVFHHLNAEHGHFDLKKEKRDEKSFIKIDMKTEMKILYLNIILKNYIKCNLPTEYYA